MPGTVSNEGYPAIVQHRFDLRKTHPTLFHPISPPRCRRTREGSASAIPQPNQPANPQLRHLRDRSDTETDGEQLCGTCGPLQIRCPHRIDIVAEPGQGAAGGLALGDSEVGQRRILGALPTAERVPGRLSVTDE